MVTALFLNSLSFAPKKLVRLFSLHKDEGCSLRKKKSMICCQDNGNAVKSTSGVSSVMTERLSSAFASTDHCNETLMDAGSLVLSPNEAEIVEKEMGAFGRKSSNNSLVETHGGVGIVEFLRGKRFLITGATGFLAKGATSYIHVFLQLCG